MLSHSPSWSSLQIGIVLVAPSLTSLGELLFEINEETVRFYLTRLSPQSFKSDISTFSIIQTKIITELH